MNKPLFNFTHISQTNSTLSSISTPQYPYNDLLIKNKSLPNILSSQFNSNINLINKQLSNIQINSKPQIQTYPSSKFIPSNLCKTEASKRPYISSFQFEILTHTTSENQSLKEKNKFLLNQIKKLEKRISDSSINNKILNENKELKNIIDQYENELRQIQKEYTELLKENKQLRLNINELLSLQKEKLNNEDLMKDCLDIRKNLQPHFYEITSSEIEIISSNSLNKEFIPISNNKLKCYNKLINNDQNNNLNIDEYLINNTEGNINKVNLNTNQGILNEDTSNIQQIKSSSIEKKSIVERNHHINLSSLEHNIIPILSKTSSTTSSSLNTSKSTKIVSYYRKKSLNKNKKTKQIINTNNLISNITIPSIQSSFPIPIPSYNPLFLFKLLYSSHQILFINISSLIYETTPYIDTSLFNDSYIEDNTITLSTSNGLIIITGSSSNIFFFYEHSTHLISQLPSLSYPHNKGAIIPYLDNSFLCLSGTNTTKCEIYNSTTSQWSDFPSMNFSHVDSSYVIMNESKIYSLFGYDSITKTFIQKVEMIDMECEHKKWDIIDIENGINLIGHQSIVDKEGKVYIVGGLKNGKENHYDIIEMAFNEENDNDKEDLNENKNIKCNISKQKLNFDNENEMNLSFEGGFMFYNENTKGVHYTVDKEFNLHMINILTYEHNVYKNN